MERLKSQDLCVLSGFLQGLYAFRDLDAFISYATAELPTLIPCDTTTYNQLDLRRHRITWIQNPQDYIQNHLGPQAQEIADRFTRQHPIVCYHRRTRNHRPVKISDLLTRREFHGLAVYHEFFRRIEVEHQLSIVLSASPRLLTGLCLSTHERDFSERDRILLSLARTHIIQAYANAEVVTLLGHAVRATSQTVILLTSDGCVRDLDPHARELLVEYFGPLRPRDRLPDTLTQWVRHNERLLHARDDAPAPLTPLIVEWEGRALTVRMFWGPSHRLLLLDERRGSPSLQPSETLETLGLTRRQTEILAWVTEGKTNDDIATILGISTRTVAKHLQMLYPKLGVETRTAAAARAFHLTPSGGRR